MENDTLAIKDDGFSLSLVGKQDVRFFKLPILTSAEDEIETTVEIKITEVTNVS